MLNPANQDGAYTAAETVALRSRGKLIAYLAARFGDVSAAEDALSEAFASALSVWPTQGCPDNPEGVAADCGSAETYRPNSSES